MLLKDALRDVVQGEILDDPETLIKYSHDASIYEIKPAVVVYPKSSEDIKNLVKFVNSHQDMKLSVTVRAAGTCMSGGSLNDSIILDVTQHMNQLIEVGDDYAITQPGIFYRDFEKQTMAEKKLLFPAYTSSREICAVGGMIGNNAAGEKSLTFGSTKNWIEELKVILRDGEEHVFRALTPEELDQKKSEDSLEGDIYRRIWQLYEDNKDELERIRPKVSKNSAGYYLWDLWRDGKFDINQLIVGSQGTLGIVTEAKMKLIHPKEHARLLVITLESLTPLADVINKVLEFKPESFECFDDHTLIIAVKYLSEMAGKFQGANWFELLKLFLPELGEQLTHHYPKLTLIAEFTADSDEEATRAAESALAGMTGLPVRAHITKDEIESKKYWLMRRESFNLLRHHITDKVAAPFIDDIIVLPEKLPEFMPRLEEVLKPYNLTLTIAGHIGNGHFHIIPLMDLTKSEAHQQIPDIQQKVFELVFEFGGSMAGEHNDGLKCAPFLKQMFGDQMYGVFEEIKRIFDPENVFNPRKKVGVTLEYSVPLIKGGAGIKGSMADYQNFNK